MATTYERTLAIVEAFAKNVLKIERPEVTYVCKFGQCNYFTCKVTPTEAFGLATKITVAADHTGQLLEVYAENVTAKDIAAGRKKYGEWVVSQNGIHFEKAPIIK